jgi:hypothetical protein
VTDEHIEPVRARDGVTAIGAVAVTLVGLALVVPVAASVIIADFALWGLQVLGKQARRGTGRALVWLIGQATRR